MNNSSQYRKFLNSYDNTKFMDEYHNNPLVHLATNLILLLTEWLIGDFPMLVRISRDILRIRFSGTFTTLLSYKNLVFLGFIMTFRV
jgi:hypothetical protein